MPDEIDRAQASEAQYLAACLSQARASHPAVPQERDAAGHVICAECGNVIPPARLASVPGAIRCARCQEEAGG